MSRLHSWLEEIAFWLLAIQLVLYVFLLYWACRLCGVRLEDDF